VTKAEQGRGLAGKEECTGCKHDVNGQVAAPPSFTPCAIP